MNKHLTNHQQHVEVWWRYPVVRVYKESRTVLLAIRRGIQPQGVQIPLKTPPPLQTRLSLATLPPRPPAMVGGLVQPTIPHEISASPKVRGFGGTRRAHFSFEEALEALEALEAPGPPWNPLQGSETPCNELRAWKPPTCMDEAE